MGQNRNLKATVDTTNFTLRFDSSAVVFNGELSDKDFWYDIFSNDDSLINYFRKKAPGRAYYVYIANIEKDNLLSYTFVIYCRPKNIEPKDINSFGYASYFIKLSRRIDKSYKVVEIKLNGLMI